MVTRSPPPTYDLKKERSPGLEEEVKCSVR